MRTKLEEDKRLRGLPSKVLSVSGFTKNAVGLLVACESGHCLEWYLSKDEARELVDRIEHALARGAS